MKRILMLILAAVLMLSICACSREPNDQELTEAPTQEPTAAPTIPEDLPERNDVKVLSALTATNPNGSKAYAYKWETIERRLITTMTASFGGDERQIAFAYQEGDRTATATGFAGDVTIIFKWDEDGNIISIQEASSGGTFFTEYTYDNGLCVERAVSRNDALASTTRYRYDDSGSCISEQTVLPDGTVSGEISLSYNEKNALVAEAVRWMDGDPEITAYSYEYDEEDRPVVRVARNNKGKQLERIEYSYAEDGSLQKEIRYEGVAEAGMTLEYTYVEVRMTDAEKCLYTMMLNYTQDWI